VDDVLVVGAGPAALAIAAALCAQGLRVAGLAARPVETPWPNTYGIWIDDLAVELHRVLGHRWADPRVFVAGRELALGREYGLFDNARLQAHLLRECERGGVVWHTGSAAGVEHSGASSSVTTRDGRQFAAHLVVDASGHKPALLNRTPAPNLAFQAAYGIVGVFSRPPVEPGQLVLMDYRAEHLPAEERQGPPTFLYGMDLGDGRYFVEETSLAHAPAVSLKLLERRLHARLAARGVAIRETQHVERCLFPMNSPLPDLDQPLLGYGGAAAMVHPPTGYQVGNALRHAPRVAAAVATVLGAPGATPAGAARAGWQRLWPARRLRRRNLYLFGLASLMRLDEQRTQAFFRAFFGLPRASWHGYMSDTLDTPALLGTMLRLFGGAPNDVRLALAASAGREHRLLRRALVVQTGA
jgi:lycopene beta-cyclase